MYFEYTQNNSGGVFTGPAIHVIVEATSKDEADKRAQELGLYFDGFGDCSCCGNRWYHSYGKGNRVPSLYGEPISDNPKYDWSTKEVPFALIYNLDGSKKIVVSKKNKRRK